MNKRKKQLPRLLLFTALLPLMGCATGKATSSTIPFYSPGPLIEAGIPAESFIVEVNGEKSFTGGPSTLFSGKALRIHVDLELLQSHAVAHIVGRDRLSTGSSATYMIVSEIRDYSWKVKSVGLLTQNASVSFKLDITISKDGVEVARETFEAIDYCPHEAEYSMSFWEEAASSSYETVSKRADKIAQSAFVATAMYLVNNYKLVLNEVLEL